MEASRNRFLVHRRLQSSIEDSLIGIAIKGAQCGIQLLIIKVETIDNGHHIRTQFGQRRLQTNLQLAQIRIRQRHNSENAAHVVQRNVHKI